MAAASDFFLQFLFKPVMGCASSRGVDHTTAAARREREIGPPPVLEVVPARPVQRTPNNQQPIPPDYADDDAALAEAIARSLESSELERALRRSAATAQHSGHGSAPARPRMEEDVTAFRDDSTPFTTDDLLRMPRITYDGTGGEDASQCSLCFEDYETHLSEIMILPCFHRFHWKCASDWLRRKPVCPVCKCHAGRTGATDILV